MPLRTRFGYNLSGIKLSSANSYNRTISMKSIIASIVATTFLIASSNALATNMPEVVKKFQCTSCHAIDHKVVGPAWMDVSKFYNGKMEKTPTGKTLKGATEGKTPEEWLVTKVSKGGAGNWGTQSMVPNDPSFEKKEGVKVLVRFILGLAK